VRGALRRGNQGGCVAASTRRHRGMEMGGVAVVGLR
jgi:hypothetical protein